VRRAAQEEMRGRLERRATTALRWRSPVTCRSATRHLKPAYNRTVSGVSAPPTLAAVEPLRVIEGGRLWLRGSGLPIPSSHDEMCTIGGVPARVVFAASDRCAVEVPPGLPGGRTEIKAPWLPGATLYVDVGVPLATGLHQVDNPAVDRQGRVYCTYSGSRGQQTPVSVFRIAHPGGPREPFVTGLVNATSLAIGPDDALYVSSRFDGTVHRIDADGRQHLVASDLGQACGLAFGPDGSLFIGDRSGTVFRRAPNGEIAALASLPASIAAFHLAFGPDGYLYVTAPTLGTYDRVYRVSMDGRVETIDESFGRPQGIAFDDSGVLHVVEALAGSSGVYQLRPPGKSLVLAGARLVGIAFAPDGAMLVATSETLYRFAP
jgi:sugar lactone lactonase YvrE